MWICLKWLRIQGDGHNKLAYTNWREIRRLLGDRIGDHFETTLREFWRCTTPKLYSKRKPEDVNAIFCAQFAALTGIAIDAATDPQWLENLSGKEARRAAEWALCELNGLPEWFDALAKVHPKVARCALRSELGAELEKATEIVHPHVLGMVRYGTDLQREIVLPVAQAALLDWPSASEETNHAYQNNLLSVVAIVVSISGATKELAKYVEERFLAESAQPTSLPWLQVLWGYDPKRALDALETARRTLQEPVRTGHTVEWIAGIFGERTGRLVSITELDTDTLVRTLLLVHAYIRREDDIEHDGVYTPAARDDAQRIRQTLFNALVAKSGADSYAALKELATNPMFIDLSDRIVLLARERAAQDSEFEAMSHAAFQQWEHEYEVAPRNRDELFAVMMNRLKDIEHDIRHDDFNDRHVLAAIHAETELQPLLARKLRDVARNHYQVTREDEVANQKKTDIRLLGHACSDRAVIEIKIADNDHSLTSLKAALENQLVDQYLRHFSCKAGCLLITYAGGKEFIDPDTSKSLPFEALIERLQVHARQLETQSRGDIKLAVFGLDLRPPLKEKSTKTKPARKRPPKTKV
ncbi:MAG: hypothetical protein LBE75_03375 [Burkholderiales bacterium]|jgi:hypothetical protein|nr:hypothetical protein [Burkholderiales bacterium]